MTIIKLPLFQYYKHICKRPFSKFHSKSLSYVSKQLPFEPASANYTSKSYLYLLGLCENLHTLKKIHALVIVNGFSRDSLCSTKLVSLYGSFGQLGFARLVFDRIPELDLYASKVMIRWYFLHEFYAEVIGSYRVMRMWVKGSDDCVFSNVLKACRELGDFDGGRKIHCEIVKAGCFDSYVLSGLVDFYAKFGEFECSRVVFEENPDRSVVSWTSMIVGCVQNDHAHEGLVLFNRMREELVQGNEFTMGSIISACTKLGSLHQGKWVHGYVVKSGIELNSHLVTALLDMYAKCGEITDARSVFGGLCGIDLVSWTAMIVGYTQSGRPKEALELFMDKKWIAILPNNVTIATVLSACAQLGNLSLGRSVHCIGFKLGLGKEIVVNALVDMYAKCQMIGDARYIFETASKKDVVTWSSIICGYSQNGSAYEALEFFHRMRIESIRPDAVTLVNVFSACALLGCFQVGSSLHAYSIKEGLLSSNLHVGTALLSFYAKCGDASSARFIFDSMEKKNVVTWSAMIGGYGIQGEGSRSLELFDDMLKEELKPNEVIFTTILSVCSHTGMVGEGWKHFTSMCRDYKFVPSHRHYACMIDLLARAGRLEEALEFIEKMPFQPSISSFGSFLHGCGLHSRFDLGELAVKIMLQLNPDKACYYVLVSNLYASDGRWSRVREVRELMQRKGLMKSPGYSLMEINGKISYHSGSHLMY